MLQNGLENKFTFTCASEDCNKTFEGKVEFNPSFFFDNRSIEQRLQNVSNK